MASIPDNPHPRSFCLRPHPCRDTRALLSTAAGPENAVAFISDNPHPRLWRLLAEHALERRDWAPAEKGFVHCRDLTVSGMR